MIKFKNRDFQAVVVYFGILIDRRDGSFLSFSAVLLLLLLTNVVLWRRWFRGWPSSASRSRWGWRVSRPYSSGKSNSTCGGFLYSGSPCSTQTRVSLLARSCRQRSLKGEGMIPISFGLQQGLITFHLNSDFPGIDPPRAPGAVMLFGFSAQISPILPQSPFFVSRSFSRSVSNSSFLVNRNRFSRLSSKCWRPVREKSRMVFFAVTGELGFMAFGVVFWLLESAIQLEKNQNG